jgi:hypothetical protein
MWWGGWLAGIALGGALVARVALAQSAPPMPLSDYWTRLEATQTLVASLESLPADQQHAALITAADEWAAVTQVSHPGGLLLPVDHSFLVARLRADPPDLPLLKETLTALLTAHATELPPPHTPRDLRWLNRILAQPEFQWQSAEPSWLQKLWRQFWNAVWRFLARLLPQNVVVTINGSWLGYALTTFAVLVVVGLVAYTLRGLFADLVAEAALRPESQADELLTADAALARAQTLSSGGDYRAAVRYLYLAALLRLEERGLLRYDRSLTNREYLRSVAHLPKLAAALREVVEVFDRVWYGYQPLDEHAYAGYATRVADLNQMR